MDEEIRVNGDLSGTEEAVETASVKSAEAEEEVIAAEEPTAETEPVAVPEMTAEQESVAAPESAAEVEPVAEPELKAEAESVTEPETIAEEEPAAEEEPIAVPEPTAEAEPAAAPEQTAEAEPTTEPEQKTEAEPAAGQPLNTEEETAAEPEGTEADKKREFSSLSAAAGKIVAAVDDADVEAASAAQEAEWGAAERAAAKEAEARSAKEAAEKAAEEERTSWMYGSGSFAQEGPMAGAKEADVDYSVAKGSSVDIFSNRRDTASPWQSGDESIGNAYSSPEKEAGQEEDPQKNDRISGSFSSIYSDTEGGGTYSPIPEEPAAKKGPAGSGLVKKILAGLLALLMCFGGGYAGSVIGNKVSSVAGGVTAGSGAGSVSISGDVESLDAASVIAEKIMPSVVGISTVSQTLTETIFGLQSGESMGIGTGLIVSEDGYILTNSHVVNDGDAETITVDLYDGTEYSGTILWNDSSLDLAIVKIDASGLTPAELGDSDTVRIGNYALAIGNPLGLDFERSVTSGIISGLNRSITVASSLAATTGNTMDGLIQTDASINSGNSGGPLINSSGQVIGINSAKASSAEGLGFAIPINVAIPIIQQIMETGTFESAYIGITGYDLAAVASSLDKEFSTSKGVYVNEVYSGSGAANAGLQSGDVIVAVEGHDVDGMSGLKKLLINYRPGDTIAVTVERNKEEMTVDVVLGSASQMTETIPSEQNQQDQNNENNPFGEGQENNNGQMPEQPENGNDSFGYGPGGLGDLFNDFFGN